MGKGAGNLERWGSQRGTMFFNKATSVHYFVWLRNGAKLASEGGLAVAGFLEWKLRPRATQHSVQECAVHGPAAPLFQTQKRFPWNCHLEDKPHPWLRPGSFSSSGQAPPNSLLAQLLYLGPALLR